MAEIPLITKYRPQKFAEVFGQDAVVTSLKAAIKAGTARSFIFTGPSGTGKTTLARIVASKLGVEARNVQEVDAAAHSSVESVRELLQSVVYVGLGGGRRMVIVDECHRVSKQGFDTLLKTIEEPPPHLYWALCTTEPGKIPATTKTRCPVFDLKPVSKDLIYEHLKAVCQAEAWPTPDDVLGVLAEKSYGSPRQALSFLAQCYTCTSRAQAAEVIRVPQEEGDEINLCRELVKGIGWKRAMELCEPLKERGGEDVRRVVADYMTKVLIDRKDDQTAVKVMAVLENFATPYPPGAGIECVVLSLGRTLLAS